MGDPTEPSKSAGDSPSAEFDAESHASDNEDTEAEVIEPATDFQSNSSHTPHQTTQAMRNSTQPNTNMDSMQSILSSISNPNVAIVIPMEGNVEDGGEEIDAERMERFYSGALTAITKMRKQTFKTETKISALRNEVGHSTMEAWTSEHCDSVRQRGPSSLSGDK